VSSKLLPFLNVYALLGYIEGDTKVRFRSLPDELSMLPARIDYDYSGLWSAARPAAHRLGEGGITVASS